MSKVTCRFCKNKIEKNKAYSPRKQLYFCNEDCYTQWLKTEDGQLDSLLDYVWQLYSPAKQNSSTYVMLKKQAEYYHNTEGLKYSGMFIAVRYYVEILERLWCDEYGLGQVLPTYYIMLRHIYEDQHKLKNKLQNIPEKYINKSKVLKGNHKNTHRKGLSLT